MFSTSEFLAFPISYITISNTGKFWSKYFDPQPHNYISYSSRIIYNMQVVIYDIKR